MRIGYKRISLYENEIGAPMVTIYSILIGYMRITWSFADLCRAETAKTTQLQRNVKVTSAISANQCQFMIKLLTLTSKSVTFQKF